MLSSDSSPLSSPPASGDELDFGESGNAGIAKFFGKTGKAAPLAESTAVSPTRQIRSPSPPHEYTHSDNPDIAFIVMFMSRFHTCFPSSLHSFGPQDLERAALEPTPGEHLEKLLCALLSLVLNRKKYVE
ncbi:MAG: hypothetical protein M1826_005519 [Phylliscum demangeonii]|nr:MAG: hypothetical protein M1826_005519 [Phylliscum demangeonii]